MPGNAGVDLSFPCLRKQGSATQLIVDGRPFLVLGGELHNSSSSSLDYMRPIWTRMVDLNCNTVLAPVSWELVEPDEGRFDFALVDGLIHDARRHGLRLIFLWFGSWKNGMSSYVPAWVKRDERRFPRVRRQDGSRIEVLSTLAEASRQADAAAFAALMRHIRQVDGGDHTVLMVQVQNEVGVLGDSRDRHPAADEAFAGPVPPELLGHLAAHRPDLWPALRERWEQADTPVSGSWEEVFGPGPEADELFMAWHYARYVDAVAAAGKAEYPLPMFVNAWLSPPAQRPGDYPSGGPLPQVLDIWLAGAPHLDLLTPDIYAAEFADWCARYTRRGNPLFIPEMRHGEDGARNVFYALGRHDALGTSPFAVDSIDNPGDSPLARSYDALSQIAPVLLEHQGRGTMTGFLLDEETPSVTCALGGYELEITRDAVFDYKAESGYGLVIATGPEEFLGVGRGFRVGFRPQTPGPARAGLAAVDQGAYHDGKWVPGRRLNGDETDQGQRWRFPNAGVSIERCTVYRYE